MYKKNMTQMIVMDLDNTLLNSDKNISDYTNSILEKCGIPVEWNIQYLTFIFYNVVIFKNTLCIVYL